MRIISTDRWNTSILDTAYDEQVRIQQVFFNIINRVVYLSKPDTTLGEYTIPYPTLINVVEDNINALIAGGYRPSNMQNTVNWKGELNDLIRFSYKDVNRWFETFEQLEGLIYSIAYRSLITGNFNTGNNRNLQILRLAPKAITYKILRTVDGKVLRTIDGNILRVRG